MVHNNCCLLVDTFSQRLVISEVSSEVAGCWWGGDRIPPLSAMHQFNLENSSRRRRWRRSDRVYLSLLQRCSAWPTSVQRYTHTLINTHTLKPSLSFTSRLEAQRSCALCAQSTLDRSEPCQPCVLQSLWTGQSVGSVCPAGLRGMWRRRSGVFWSSQPVRSLHCSQSVSTFWQNKIRSRVQGPSAGTQQCVTDQRFLNIKWLFLTLFKIKLNYLKKKKEKNDAGLWNLVSTILVLLHNRVNCPSETFFNMFWLYILLCYSLYVLSWAL